MRTREVDGRPGALAIEATAEGCASCTLQAPWGAARAVEVNCARGGSAAATVPTTVDGDRVTWDMSCGDVCTVTPASAHSSSNTDIRKPHSMRTTTD